MPDLIVNGRGETRFISPMPEERDASQFPAMAERPTADEHLLEYQRRQEYQSRLERSRSEIYIETPTNKVQLLGGWGDLHLGAPGCDVAKVRYIKDGIKKRPNARFALMGDVLDMLYWQNEDVMTMSEQVDMIRAFAKELVDDGKVLVSIGGNHNEEWLWKSLGMEFFVMAYGYNNLVPYMRDGGDVFWKIGSEQYQLRLRHRTRYNSDLNPTHTNHREYWMACPNADLVWIGHGHQVADEEWNFRREGREVHVGFARTGSMKDEDRFRDSRGFIPRWSTDIVCACFRPDRHEMWQVTGIDRGLRLQEMLQWEMDHHDLPVQTIIKGLS